MLKYIYNEDIAYAEVDLIINASNGIGWMGGKNGAETKLKGVAESIHFASKGEVEKLAKAECIKRSVFGLPPATVFTTDAPNLNAKKVLHAVTMRFPGSTTSKEVIAELVNNIVDYLDNHKGEYQTIAIPFLGCGTGGVNKEDVRKIYEEKFENRPETFFVYEYSETENNGQSILSKRKFGKNVMTKKEIAKRDKSILAKRKYGKDN